MAESMTSAIFLPEASSALTISSVVSKRADSAFSAARSSAIELEFRLAPPVASSALLVREAETTSSRPTRLASSAAAASATSKRRSIPSRRSGSSSTIRSRARAEAGRKHASADAASGCSGKQLKLKRRSMSSLAASGKRLARSFKNEGPASGVDSELSACGRLAPNLSLAQASQSWVNIFQSDASLGLVCG
ncbi:hypothetical protein FQZ97_1038120 [compost metagenome]